MDRGTKFSREGEGTQEIIILGGDITFKRANTGKGGHKGGKPCTRKGILYFQYSRLKVLEEGANCTQEEGE